jgi:hypothetical protein
MVLQSNAVEERENNNETVLSIDFITLAVCRRSLDALASHFRITVMFSEEQAMERGF